MDSLNFHWSRDCNTLSDQEFMKFQESHPDIVIPLIKLSCEINSKPYVLYAFNKLFYCFFCISLHYIVITLFEKKPFCI